MNVKKSSGQIVEIDIKKIAMWVIKSAITIVVGAFLYFSKDAYFTIQSTKKAQDSAKVELREFKTDINYKFNLYSMVKDVKDSAFRNEIYRRIEACEKANRV